MVNALFNQPGYLASKRLMDATVLRHEALASNLANVEMPGYKRIDIAPDFLQELRQAMKSGDTQSLTQMQPSLVVDVTAVAKTRNGNTVNMEKELLGMSQNTMAHNLETQLITRTLVKLRTAINSRTA